MLFSLDASLDDRIVEILAATPGLTVEQLLPRVQVSGQKWGVHAVYKQLRKLTKGGVIVKEGRSHYLRAHWISDFLALGDTLESRSQREDAGQSFLPAPGKRVTWRFSSLLRLNDFSSSVLLQMCKASTSSQTFSWHPHSWFWLVHPAKEARHWEQLRKGGVHRYMIVGGDTALDQWIASRWPVSSVTSRLGASVPQADQFTYFVVAAPYVLWLRLDRECGKAIEKVFGRSKGMGQVDAATFFEAFRAKHGRQRMIVEHNAKRCATIKRYYRSFFGLGKEIP